MKPIDGQSQRCSWSFGTLRQQRKCWKLKEGVQRHVRQEEGFGWLGMPCSLVECYLNPRSGVMKSRTSGWSREDEAVTVYIYGTSGEMLESVRVHLREPGSWLGRKEDIALCWCNCSRRECVKLSPHNNSDACIQITGRLWSICPSEGMEFTRDQALHLGPDRWWLSLCKRIGECE